MPAVTLGVQTDRSQGGYGELAAAAEAAGFDGLSCFADLGYQPPLAPLMEMATATRRARLGPAGLSPALVHPVEMAGQASILDRASGGRSYLGIVRGAWLDDVGAVAERPLRRLAETAEVVRRLLAGDDSGWEGQLYRLAPGFRLRGPAGRSRVDLLVGTWGPQGLALAAEIADEVKLGGCANPDMVAWARARLDDAGGQRVRLVAGAVTVVDRDRAAAREAARREVAPYLGVVAPLDRTFEVPADSLARLRAALAAGDIGAAGRAVPDGALDRFAFAGTPSEVAAHAVALVDAGAERIELGPPWGLGGDVGLGLLAAAVVPEVHAR